MIGAISEGETRIRRCLDSKDVQSTCQVLRSLGVKIALEGDVLVVHGRGLRGFQSLRGDLKLDMGNSGTTTRLLMGLLAGHPFQATLIGDESLSKRPMRRVTEPLEKMGAKIEGPHGKDWLPLTIQGGPLRGITYPMLVPSAQVKSAILLAGLYAQGSTTVAEPVLSRDHTERMLRHFGARLIQKGLNVTVESGTSLQARELTIPGDISSAAFFLVAAAIVPGSEITIQGIGLNPTRTGILDLLKEMGADISVRPDPGSSEWEPVGEVTVRGGPLQAVTVGPEMIPRVIDELPILMVAATQAKGRTLIRGAGELRVKETDRISSMVAGLSAMGAHIEEGAGNAIAIDGPVSLRGAQAHSFGDHRTAMALAVAGLAARGETRIEGSEWIDISFPSFAATLQSLCRNTLH